MMKTMRVVHVLSGLDRRLGGVVQAVLGLAAAQVKTGLEVAVLSSFQPGEDNTAADDLRSAGVRVTLVGPVVRRLAHWSAGNQRAAVAAVASVEVVHIHALWEDIYHQAMRAARRRGVPYVVSPHGMLSPWSLSQSRWRKRIYLALRLRRDLNAAAAIHGTTREEARQLATLRLRPPTIVEPIGLDLREFVTLPPPGFFRNRFPATAGRPIILFLGRLAYQKGLDVLIPAFARADTGDARLVLAGPDDDGYAATVRALIDRYGVADRVLFTGMLRGVERVAALADADLFVLPSHQENFGIVVLEAMAAGTAVVISDRVNFTEFLSGNQFGAVVPCTVDAVARALTEWMRDGPRRAEAGAAARAFATERFDWTTLAPRWAEHYERLVAPVLHPQIQEHV